MDWYSLWDAEKNLPKPQHLVTKALRALSIVGVLAGVLLLFQGKGLTFLLAGTVAGITTWALALAVDALLWQARLQVEWYGRHTREIDRLEDRDRAADQARTGHLAAG